MDLNRKIIYDWEMFHIFHCHVWFDHHVQAISWNGRSDAVRYFLKKITQQNQPKNTWLWINTYILIPFFSGVIHIHHNPAILMWTHQGYYWFWHTKHIEKMPDSWHPTGIERRTCPAVTILNLGLNAMGKWMKIWPISKWALFWG